MKTSEYLKRMRKIKDVSFATIGRDGHPASRMIDIMLAGEDCLYFLTARGKEFYEQLMEQEFAAVSCMNNNWQMFTLRGKVKKVSQDMLTQIFEENPSMNEVYPGDSRNILEVFCLYEGQGEFFDLSCTPIFRETFLLGGWQEISKGYEIGEACIACGICETVCPQNCIERGTPFVIRQEHCLHCGLCVERCPAQAIYARQTAQKL